MESKNNTTMEEEETSCRRMRILEINLISAQNLKNIIKGGRGHRNMHTYAVAWVDPHHKLRSDLDRIGGVNPTWNDKFLFRVSQPFLNGDTSAVQFHIYAVGFIRDYFIGTVRYLLSSSNSRSSSGVPSFSALHIRRPSGRVHGVLNIAATVYNSCDFPSLTGVNAICFRDLIRLNNNKKNRINGEGGKISRYLSRYHLGLKTSSYKSYESSETTDDQASSCGEDSGCFSEESCKTVTAFGHGKTTTTVGSSIVMAGNKSNGGLCGLLTRRSTPSLQNLFKLKLN